MRSARDPLPLGLVCAALAAAPGVDGGARAAAGEVGAVVRGAAAPPVGRRAEPAQATEPSADAAASPHARPAPPGTRRAFALDDLARLRTIGEVVVAPNGRLLAIEATETNLEENRRNSDLYLLDVDGGTPRRLTTSPQSDSRPRFSPDGSEIAFLSSRSGSPQIWRIAVSGGEARQATDVPGGVEGHRYTPDGKSFVFLARVVPGTTLEETRKRDEAMEKEGSRVLVHDRLLYRHWNSYDDGKVLHFFRTPVEGGTLDGGGSPGGGGATAGTGAPVDLTPSLRHDAVQWHLASTMEDYDLAPDGSFLVFAANLEDRPETSYDVDLYRIPLEGGEPVCLTEGNPAADSGPRVSPDGKRVAYHATSRPGYESDRYRLVVMELATGATHVVTEGLDRTVLDHFWDPKGETLYFTTYDEGNVPLSSVPAAGGPIRRVLEGPHWHEGVRLAADGETLVFTRRNVSAHREVYRGSIFGGEPRRITGFNDALYEEVATPAVDELWAVGGEGPEAPRVHAFLLKPHGFDPGKKHPLVVLVHGGPQQMFGNAWRNDYAVFSGAGYGVLFANPRGSFGYGQAFTDGVRLDWGGKPVADVERALDEALRVGWIDAERIAAMGGSFGGYVTSWLQGHSTRFRALVSHAGVTNLFSKYGTTEELFFPEWEFGGPPYGENEEIYDRLSPIRYAKDFKTPMLLLHGDLDYRVPVGQAEEMFTALQRLGVPSRFVRFPDEGHWITKPKNQLRWYRECLEFLAKHLAVEPDVEASSETREKPSGA